MKKVFLLLMIISIAYSCSNNDDALTTDDMQITDDGMTDQEDEEEETSSLILNLNATDSAVIDEVFSLTITSNEAMRTIIISYNDFETTALNRTIPNGDGFGTEATFYFDFDTLGNQTIYIKVLSVENSETIATKTINITRGNAVKITQLEVTSFFDIDQTWDPEFPENDSNRLADVFFVLNKSNVSIEDSNVFNRINWYTSTIEVNQGDLFWDLNNEEVYINENGNFRFALGDSDGDNIGQDLIINPPFYVTLDLSKYSKQRPNFIELTSDPDDLQVILQIDWP